MIVWIAIFFAAGIVLIISEFFLPGGVLGGMGIVLVLLSGTMGVYQYPDYAVFIIIGELGAVALGIALGLYILTRTRASKLLTLQHQLSHELGYVSATTDVSLLNEEGMALTPLRPAGVIAVADKRVDAVSDGIYIEEGTQVRVIEVQGNRVVVEPIERN